MTIAFASVDGKHINQHFGWSKSFYLYRVDKETYSFIEEIDSSQEIEAENQKLDYKIGCIDSADIMYCSQIGPKASKMVQSAGIYPVRTSEDEKISDAIARIQETLNTDNPPPWLLRIYYKAAQREAS
jgi:nitrogen fixation protein NifX